MKAGTCFAHCCILPPPPSTELAHKCSINVCWERNEWQRTENGGAARCSLSAFVEMGVPSTPDGSPGPSPGPSPSRGVPPPALGTWGVSQPAGGFTLLLPGGRGTSPDCAH